MDLRLNLPWDYYVIGYISIGNGRRFVTVAADKAQAPFAVYELGLEPGECVQGNYFEKRSDALRRMYERAGL